MSDVGRRNLEGVVLVIAGWLLIGVPVVIGFKPVSQETWMHFRLFFAAGAGLSIGAGLIMIGGAVTKFIP